MVENRDEMYSLTTDAILKHFFQLNTQKLPKLSSLKLFCYGHNGQVEEAEQLELEPSQSRVIF